MDQKERVIWELEIENRASHPDQKFPGIPPRHPGELLSSLFECWFLLQSTTIHPGCFGVGRRPKSRAAKLVKPVPSGMVWKNSFARVTIKTWVRPETVHGKSLAPRVFPIPHPCQILANPAFRVAVKSRIPLTLPLSRTVFCWVPGPENRPGELWIQTIHFHTCKIFYYSRLRQTLQTR